MIDCMDNLLVLQQRLQEEARSVLEKLKIVSRLKEYGSVHIIGSLELGLMVWKDIDIEVVTNNNPVESAVKMVEQLLHDHWRRFDFILLDNRELRKDLPNGVYLGIKYYGDIKDIASYKKAKEEVWKIDIWFLSESDAKTGKDHLNWIKKRMTPQLRSIILAIKKELSVAKLL